MLRNTFVHIPGIGYATERKLWQAGVACWEDCMGAGFAARFGSAFVQNVRGHLRHSAAALEKLDGAFFAESLPARQIWRVYPEFKHRAVFLDIETTGLWADRCDITVISLFDGHETRALVRGRDLDDFPEVIKRYSLIVTYNGRTFDLPFLRAKFGHLDRGHAHIDLRYPLHRLGLSGGLKAVERQLGIEREGALSLVDGFMAVQLWYEHKRGCKTALDTLLRYSLEDVVNLQYLMEKAYNEHLNELPLRVPKLRHSTPPRVDIPFDEKLILHLRRRARF